MTIKMENEIEKIHKRLERLMNTFFREMTPIPMFLGKRWVANTDVFETEKELIIVIEAAGLKKEDFNIILKKDRLYVSGYRKERFNNIPNKNYHQVEIPYGPFEQIYPLPFSVKTENISAVYKDGFLEIKLPKKEIATIKSIEDKE
jgi:HSP20 family protein